MKPKEERKYERTNISWPVSIWVPAINRFLNGIIVGEDALSENMNKF